MIRKLKAIFLIYYIFAIYNLLNYDRLSKKPLLFRSFTGLELSQFDSICKEVEYRYPEYEIKRLSKRKKKKKRRTRSIGAGRHFKLTVRNRFLMLLVYYKLYITHTLAGFLFDLYRSKQCISGYMHAIWNH